MRYTRLVSAAAAVLLGVACSDSTGTPASKSSDWSGAVIKVAATIRMRRESCAAWSWIRRRVWIRARRHRFRVRRWCSTSRSQCRPVTGGSDTAWTTVTKIGEVVTDANGRFLVTSIPPGDYYLAASPPANEPFYSNSTWAFVSSGNNDRRGCDLSAARAGHAARFERHGTGASADRSADRLDVIRSTRRANPN